MVDGSFKFPKCLKSVAMIHCITKPNKMTQEGHSGPESLTCTMYTSLVQWKVMI